MVARKKGEEVLLSLTGVNWHEVEQDEKVIISVWDAEPSDGDIPNSSSNFTHTAELKIDADGFEPEHETKIVEGNRNYLWTRTIERRHLAEPVDLV